MRMTDLMQRTALDLPVEDMNKAMQFKA